MTPEAIGETTFRERPDPELKPGAVVGDYRVESKLGEGGFGVVYRAVHPVIGKRAAVKVLSRELSSDPEIVSRFEGEARAVNAISHGNIVDIFNIGTLDDGRHYLVMELLSGETFEAVLVRGRVDPTLLVEVVRGVAGALEAAHGTGVVHRDIKPENIYLHRGKDGRLVPKLLDFGVAKLLTRGLAHHQTTTGAPIGTPRYMSPEQCLARAIDSRTDIYALGVLCFEALTGAPPFDAPSLLELMNMHTLAPRPLVSTRVSDLGTAFDAPIARMMAIDRQERPHSALVALAELERALAELHARPLMTHQAAASRDTEHGRNTPTDMIAAPASSSGQWPQGNLPMGSVPGSVGRISTDPLSPALPQVEREPPTLVRPPLQSFPVTTQPGGFPAATLAGIGPLPPKQNTLGATSSSLDVRVGGKRSRAAVAIGAVSLLLVCGVALAIILTSGEPEPVSAPDGARGQAPTSRPATNTSESGDMGADGTSPASPIESVASTASAAPSASSNQGDAPRPGSRTRKGPVKSGKDQGKAQGKGPADPFSYQ